MAKTLSNDAIDKLIEEALKCNRTLYSFETQKYRIDIMPKKLDDLDIEYPGIKKFAITIRDATFAARKKKIKEKR